MIPAASGIAEMVDLSHESRAELIRGVSDQVAKPDVMIVDTGPALIKRFKLCCSLPNTGAGCL